MTRFPKIKKITLLLAENTTDTVFVFTNFPSPMPKVTPQSLILEFKCAHGSGRRYIQENFGCEPDEIIDTRIIDARL